MLPLHEVQLSGERALLERERLRGGMSDEEEQRACAGIERSLRDLANCAHPG